MLRGIVERAFDPYLDRGLERRVAQAQRKWKRQAERAVVQQIDPRSSPRCRPRPPGCRTPSTISTAGWQQLGPFTLPAIAVPQPKVDLAEARQALVGFGDDWLTATRALIARKGYAR